MTDATCTRYVIWTASGMSAPRSGAPLAFSPDGTLLAVMHDPTPFLGEGRTFPPTGPLVKPTLDIVRTSTGESVARADNVSWAYATNVLFSPDGRRVAFLMRMPDRPSSDGFAILDVASGTVSILDAGLGAVLGWTADDRLLVASQAPGAPAPKGLQVTALDTAGIVDTIAVSSTGRIAAAQARDWTTRTRTLTLELGAERETLEMSGFPGILVWSPDGSTLLAVCHGSWSQSPDQESPDQVVLVRP
jgi:DNA-binding beta-propeller fold protein YncE